MFEELTAQLDDVLSRVSSRHRVRPGARGQTVEATAKATIHEISAWDLELVHDARTALIAAQAEIDRLTEAMHRIKDWSEAYPPDVFTPLSADEQKAAVDAMQAAVSNGSDRMHASWARYLMGGVGETARAALAPKE